jgi:uncharacterized protein (DUF1330 family)
MKHLFYLLSLCGAFLLGAITFGTHRSSVVAGQTVSPPADPPAYLLAVGKRLKPPEALAAYRKAAGPLAMAAGYQGLASQSSKASVQVLEGDWPYEGFVTLEKFTSMPALLKFWNSPEYQAAKKLRTDASKIDFIIAVEGNR